MGKNHDFNDEYEYEDYYKPGSSKGKVILIFLGTLTLVIAGGLSILLIMNNLRNGSKNNEYVDNIFERTMWEVTPIEEEKTTESQIESETPEDIITIDIPEEDKEYTHIIQTASDDSITIGFAGDILFDTNYAVGNTFARVGASGVIGESLLSRMNSVDIMMVNNEFPYSYGGTPTEGKTYTFRADPSSASLLNDMGVDIVGLANNHAYDYGEMALLDTFTALDNVGVEYVGAGKNIDEASHPVYYVTENGFKLAFICATQIERLSNPDTKEATATSAGVFRCLDDSKLLEMIRQAKEKDAFVIVFVHWGSEGTDELHYLQREQAIEMTEAGANLIIGGHPHVLQKIEYINSVPVVYSLGNYIFNSKTLDTCMITATIAHDNSVSLRFIPAIQSDCRVKEAYGEEAQRIINYMSSISPGITIDQNGYISR